MPRPLVAPEETDDDGVSGTLEAMEIEVLGERLGRDGTSSIVMSQASVKRAAVCLLVIAVVLAAVGFSMKDEVNWEQRTLDTQSARLAAQRGTLVRKQAMDFVDRGAKQAKLLKVLTVMQAELSREARGMDRLGQLEGEFQGDIDRHHAQIDALVEKMFSVFANPVFEANCTSTRTTVATALVMRMAPPLWSSLHEV